MALYRLAANCKYREMQSKMIRDKLVVGIGDSALSEQLQMKADLTLERAKKTIRQREAVHEQQRELKSPNNIKSVDAMTRTNHNRAHYNANWKFHPKSMTVKPKNCIYLVWKRSHSKDKCPAKDAECYRCKRKGHFGSMCFSKANTVHSVEAGLTSAFLDNLLLKLQRQYRWPTYSWRVNKHPLN